VLIADVILLVAEFYVIQDLQWRTTFAASPHGSAPHGYSPSFAYNIFTQFFTMSGNQVNLTSPATLDWVQLFTAALVVLNLWFAYTYWKRRKTSHPSAPAAAEGETPQAQPL